MQRRFSEMDRVELLYESERLKREAKQKKQQGYESEANMLEKKFYLCVSYLLNPNTIVPGETYCIQGESGELKVEYLNGVFAWGTLTNEKSGELVAYPIGQLYQEKPAYPFEV